VIRVGASVSFDGEVKEGGNATGVSERDSAGPRVLADFGASGGEVSLPGLGVERTYILAVQDVTQGSDEGLEWLRTNVVEGRFVRAGVVKRLDFVQRLGISRGEITVVEVDQFADDCLEWRTRCE